MVKFLSQKLTLSDGGTGRVVFKAPEPLSIHKLVTHASGDVEVELVEIVGGERLLVGTMHLQQLREHGSTFTLEPPLELDAGRELLIQLYNPTPSVVNVYVGVVYEPRR